MRALAAAATLCLIAFTSAACGGPPVDLKQALKVDVVSGGWYDAGIVDGQNKLVPAVNIRLTNTSNTNLVTLQLNAIFRRVSASEEWGSAFMTAAGSSGLAPGATTGVLLLKSANGYTGSGESRQEMLQNSHFVDAKVELQAKYSSNLWVRLGEFPIPRQLLLQQ